MSLITIIAEPVTIYSTLERFAEPIRIPQTNVVGENIVVVKKDVDVVGNGFYELGNNFPYNFGGGAIQL
jgi:hypothetical protein